MRITAVIAECNPFHSGHAHLFKTIKEKHKSDAIMVILSGDFVQRGEPAVIDKFARTRMVLEGGADLVLELPVRFALSSAEGFARAGVAAMLNSGVATELSFGMETDYSKTHFIRLCEYLSEEPNEFKELLRKLLKTGISYPAARQQALKQCLPDFDESIINTPNNILAIEYQKALYHFEKPLFPIFPVTRIPEVNAHSIREQMQNNGDTGLYTNDFSKAFALQFINGELPFKHDSEFTEELYYRLQNLINYSASLKDWIGACKTKQYTYSRISRCFFRYMLNLSDNRECNTANDYAPYLRVLGFRKASANIIKMLKQEAKVPVLQKLTTDQKQLDAYGRRLLNEDLRAHEIYRLHLLQKYPDLNLNDDFSNGVIMLDNS